VRRGGGGGVKVFFILQAMLLEVGLAVEFQLGDTREFVIRVILTSFF
jgi:hypothetical protein